MRRTKIVSTLGPSSHTIEAIEKLAKAGASVFRLNFSHGDFEEHGHRIKQIRRIEEKSGKRYPIILDTKGPDIRTEDIDKKIEVKKGDRFIWTIDADNDYFKTGKNKVSYPEFIDDVEVGDVIVVDSGAFNMTVTEKTKTDVICNVEQDGKIGCVSLEPDQSCTSHRCVGESQWIECRGGKSQAAVAARLAALELKAHALPGELHRLTWQEGRFSLSGSVTVHDGTIVSLTASRIDSVLLSTWAKLLLLAQSDIRAEAHLIGTTSRYGRTSTSQLRLRQPTRSTAVELLRRLLQAVSIGRQRLLPLPENAALSYLRYGEAGFELARTEFKAAWRFRSAHWELFYDGPASELFAAGDPPAGLPSAKHGAFGAWANAIYQPILDAVI